MSESYLRGKFGQAVSGLAEGAEPLAERVRKALVILTMFSPEDMPDKWSREEFAKLRRASTDQQAEGDEGNLAATLDGMTVQEVQGFGRSIVELHDHLIRRIDKRYADDQESDEVA
jgi:hypothetical protein